MNGASHAVHLPEEFRFEGSEVQIAQEGGRIVLSPVKNALVDFLQNGPCAYSDFFQDQEDLPVHEREVFRWHK